MTEKIKCDENDYFEVKLLFSSLRHKKISRYVQIIGVILNVLGCIHCIIGKSLLLRPMGDFRNEVVTIFINCLSDATLSIFNIVAILIYMRSAFMTDLVCSLKKFDAGIEPTSIIFCRSIQVLRIGPIIPIMIDAYFMGYKIGWSTYQYFLPRSVWYYCHSLMICSFACFVKKIEWHFIHLNNQLEELNKTFPDKNVPDMIHEKYSKVNLSLESLTEISTRYNFLCNLLDKLNRYFKSFLVLAFICISMNLLHNCTVLTEFGVKPKVINGINTKVFVFIIQISMALFTVGQAAVGAFEGENLQDEGERTSSICYSLLTKMNRNSKNENQNLIIKELEFLLDQSKSRRICLHAGGFFEVNWGILGSITSTVATYSIVIIQFLLK